MEKCMALLDSAAGPGSVRMALEQALSSRGLYFFGAVADHPAVSTLKGTEAEGWIHVLNIFCHGTYSDFRAQRSKLPALSDRAVAKLKQLSLMTMAATMPRLAYSGLQAELDLASVPEVEDLVISSVDAGLLEAKLSQRDQAVVVQSVRGRELAVSDIPAALAKLDAWQAAIQASIRRVEAEAAAASGSFKDGAAEAGRVAGEVGRRSVTALEKGEAGVRAKHSSGARGGARGMEAPVGMFGGMSAMLGLGGRRHGGGRH